MLSPLFLNLLRALAPPCMVKRVVLINDEHALARKVRICMLNLNIRKFNGYHRFEVQRAKTG